MKIIRGRFGKGQKWGGWMISFDAKPGFVTLEFTPKSWSWLILKVYKRHTYRVHIGPFQITALRWNS